MQYKLQKKYQQYDAQILLNVYIQFNFLSISVNTCKRDPLNLGPIRMCRIITILSVKYGIHNDVKHEDGRQTEPKGR